jgi:hypothetical protein
MGVPVWKIRQWALHQTCERYGQAITIIQGIVIGPSFISKLIPKFL